MGKDNSREHKLEIEETGFGAQNSATPVERVVAIASSAGGINALTQVFSGFPADVPAAIIVVQHLRSDRMSNLPQLLARSSKLRVIIAEEGLSLEEGVAYMAMPGKHLVIRGSRMYLNTKEPENYVRPSADVLFTSAANAFGHRVIGVILSGTGHDGAQGCREIKTKGGLTIAQDEMTSRYFDMPRAAIAANAIDYVLPVGDIAGKIVELLKIDKL
jgi:chemotaxis response regulator CheB